MLLNITEKSMKADRDTLFQVTNLLYWVQNWQLNLHDVLENLFENHSCQPGIESHIKNLIAHK